MATRMRALIFALAAFGVLVTAAACGDDEADSNSSAQQSDIDTINATIQDNEVLFAIVAMGTLPLHDMDEAINAGTVEDDYLPAARDAIRYLGMTDWPSSLEAEAQEVEDAAIALAAALDEGDTEAAKQPATDLHEGWHEFEGEGLGRNWRRPSAGSRNRRQPRRRVAMRRRLQTIRPRRKTPLTAKRRTDKHAGPPGPHPPGRDADVPLRSGVIPMNHPPCLFVFAALVLRSPPSS